MTLEQQNQQAQHRLNIPAMLSLRYDPTKPTQHKRLTPADFEPLFYNSNIQELILTTLDVLMPYPKEVSILLSAGVDSRFTLDMFRRFRPETKITAVVVGFEDGPTDENRVALELAYKYDVNCISVTRDKILSDLPKLVKAVNEPRWNLYTFYAYEKCPTKQVYAGDGADELWSGYVWRYSKTGDVNTYLASHARDRINNMQELLPNYDEQGIKDLIAPNFTGNRLSYADRCLMADYNGKLLYDYLPTGAALTKLLKKKLDSLFLIPAMIFLATHTPWQKKLDGEYGKLPLQNILGTRIPKKGFSPPLEKIWYNEGRELYRYYVNENSQIVKDRVINGEWVAKNQEPKDAIHINKMLQLVALELWYRDQHKG